MEPTACDVLGTRPFLQSGANAVRILLADFRKASGGVVPVLRQGQHHGEQPFGFQRQPCVAQVVVGHHRVVAGFLNAKYRHHITSFRRSKIVLVFWGKDGHFAAQIPQREKPMGGGLLANWQRKNMGFMTPFRAVLGRKNAIAQSSADGV